MANKVYGAREDLGNKGGNDGYNFIGRGLKQLTGRGNYTKFQTFYNNENPNDKKDFLNNEEHRKEIATNPKLVLLSTVYFWSTYTHVAPQKGHHHRHYRKHFQGKKSYEIADDTIKTDQEKSESITYIVNRGTNTYGTRYDEYKRIRDMQIFKDFPSKE